MSKEIFQYRLSPFALSVVEEDRKYYYQQLEHLKCHDPLAIPLPLFKCGKPAGAGLDIYGSECTYVQQL
jgi:hypothetical protein